MNEIKTITKKYIQRITEMQDSNGGIDMNDKKNYDKFINIQNEYLSKKWKTQGFNQKYISKKIKDISCKNDKTAKKRFIDITYRITFFDPSDEELESLR